MFSLAANLILGFTASLQGVLSPRENAIWRDIQPAMVVVMNGGQERGVAALIDTSGLFMASKASAGSSPITGRLFSGKIVRLRVIAEDRFTQLILLQAQGWDRGSARPFRAPSGNAVPGDVLFAVQPFGPSRIELISANRIGVSGQSRRLIPLLELRCESQLLTGPNVLVVGNGEVYGVVTSTLGQPVPTVTANRLGGFGGNGKSAFPLNSQFQSNLGPGNLTVAYVPGLEVMRRVINGFLAPDHKVLHPYLGVICRDAPGGGAMVETVVVGSGAQKAGIRIGDVIVSIGGDSVADQIGFAQVMLRQRVGDKITVTVRRGPYETILNAVVGHEAN